MDSRIEAALIPTKPSSHPLIPCSAFTKIIFNICKKRKQNKKKHLHVYPFLALPATKHLFPPPKGSLKKLVHTKEVRHYYKEIKYIPLLSLPLFSLWGSLTSRVNLTSVPEIHCPTDPNFMEGTGEK